MSSGTRVMEGMPRHWDPRDEEQAVTLEEIAVS